jgi:N-terminal domain on NACHT_NTPase and P-loop NTPases
MSGAEGIVALGIAGNVVQFVDSGVKLCSRIREYSAAAGAPNSLATQAACISDILEILKDLSDAQKGALDQRLISRCASKADELSALLDTFINKDGSRSSAWKNAANAWRSLRAERKVADLQKTLESLLKPLNLNLLAKTT